MTGGKLPASLGDVQRAAQMITHSWVPPSRAVPCLMQLGRVRVAMLRQHQRCCIASLRHHTRFRAALEGWQQLHLCGAVIALPARCGTRPVAPSLASTLMHSCSDKLMHVMM